MDEIYKEAEKVAEKIIYDLKDYKFDKEYLTNQIYYAIINSTQWHTRNGFKNHKQTKR